MKIVKKIQLKIVIFTAVKNCCILHGRVFVMFYNKNNTTLINLYQNIEIIVQVFDSNMTTWDLVLYRFCNESLILTI